MGEGWVVEQGVGFCMGSVCLSFWCLCVVGVYVWEVFMCGRSLYPVEMFSCDVMQNNLRLVSYLLACGKEVRGLDYVNEAGCNLLHLVSSRLFHPPIFPLLQLLFVSLPCLSMLVCPSKCVSSLAVMAALVV